MPLGTSDISTSVVNTELGIVTPIRDISLLNNYASQNLWSFTRGGRIKPNVTTKLVELYDPGSDYKEADWRSYNHTASAPEPFHDVIHKWGPGGTTTDVQSVIIPNLLNIKEAQYYSGATSNYYTIDLYSSSSDRASKINRLYRLAVAITFTSWTIPTNHTLQDIGVSQRAESPQIVTLTGVSTSYAKYYVDTYVSDVSSIERIRFPNSFSEIDMSEYQYPIMRTTAAIQSGDLPAGNSPAGYPWTVTGSYMVLFNATTPKDSNGDVIQTFGSTSYSFYWNIVLRDTMSNAYTAGVSSIDLRTYLNGVSGSDQSIQTGAANSDPTTQVQSSGTIDRNFNYDDQWYVYYDTSSGITYNGVYSLI